MIDGAVCARCEQRIAARPTHDKKHLANTRDELMGSLVLEVLGLADDAKARIEEAFTRLEWHNGHRGAVEAVKKTGHKRRK